MKLYFYTYNMNVCNKFYNKYDHLEKFSANINNYKNKIR